MAEARDYIVGFLLIALFSIAFISFGITFAQNQNSNINIANDTRINTLYTELNDSIYNYDSSGSVQTVANSTLDSYDTKDTAGETIAEFVFKGIIGVAKTILGVVNVFYEATLEPVLSLVLPGNQGVKKLLGVMLTTILLFVMVLVAWRLVKNG